MAVGPYDLPTHTHVSLSPLLSPQVVNVYQQFPAWFVKLADEITSTEGDIQLAGRISVSVPAALDMVADKLKGGKERLQFALALHQLVLAQPRSSHAKTSSSSTTTATPKLSSERASLLASHACKHFISALSSSAQPPLPPKYPMPIKEITRMAKEHQPPAVYHQVLETILMWSPSLESFTQWRDAVPDARARADEMLEALSQHESVLKDGTAATQLLDLLWSEKQRQLVVRAVRQASSASTLAHFLRLILSCGPAEREALVGAFSQMVLSISEKFSVSEIESLLVSLRAMKGQAGDPSCVLMAGLSSHTVGKRIDSLLQQARNMSAGDRNYRNVSGTLFSD